MAAAVLAGTCVGTTVAQTHAIVGNYGVGTIDMIELSTQTVVRTFTTAGNAEGVAYSPDASKVYFAGAGHVMGFDAETGTQLFDVGLGTSLGGIVVHPNGQVAYVSFGTDHAVKVFDLATAMFTATIDMPTNTLNMSMTPDGSTLYATSSNFMTGQSALSVIDTATNTVTASYPLPYLVFENALSPDGTIVLASSEFNSKLLRVDLGTGQVLEMDMPGGPRTIRFSADGETAYVANAYVGQIVAVDVMNGIIVSQWDVGGGPYSFAMTSDETEAYVSDFFNDVVKRVDTATGQVVGTIPVGRRPFAVQMRPKAPTCAADFNADGFLDFFDYDAYVLCFESADCPEGKTADFNGDGFADFFDYDDYVGAFEAGC